LFSKKVGRAWPESGNTDAGRPCCKAFLESMKMRRLLSIVVAALIVAAAGVAHADPAPAAPQPAKGDKKVPAQGESNPGKDQPNAVLCTVYPPKLPRGATKAGLVIHLYGRRGSHLAYNISRPPYAALRQLLADRGYWIVVPELGGDHWMNDKAVKTLDALIDAMIAAAGVRVRILGNSMGAGSGLVYVAQRPGVIRSICAMYPMTDFNAWLVEKPGFAASVSGAYFDRDPAKVQLTLKQRSPMQNINAFAKTPVLLLHGDADSAVPIHHSRDFAAALAAKGCPVTLHEAPGFDHDDRIAEKYQTEIADFLTGKLDHGLAEAEKLPTPKPILTVDLGSVTKELLFIRPGDSTKGSENNNDEKVAKEAPIAKPFRLEKYLVRPELWQYRGLAGGWLLYTGIVPENAVAWVQSAYAYSETGQREKVASALKEIERIDVQLGAKVKQSCEEILQKKEQSGAKPKPGSPQTKPVKP
jgi:pimeloyl-ACP methyl ester carboxylesterase